MIERITHLIEDAYGHVAAANIQMIPSDDQIIAGHVQSAETTIKQALKLLRELEAKR